MAPMNVAGRADIPCFALAVLKSFFNASNCFSAFLLPDASKNLTATWEKKGKNGVGKNE